MIQSRLSLSQTVEAKQSPDELRLSFLMDLIVNYGVHMELVHPKCHFWYDEETHQKKSHLALQVLEVFITGQMPQATLDIDVTTLSTIYLPMTKIFRELSGDDLKKFNENPLTYQSSNPVVRQKLGELKDKLKEYLQLSSVSVEMLDNFDKLVKQHDALDSAGHHLGAVFSRYKGRFAYCKKNLELILPSEKTKAELPGSPIEKFSTVSAISSVPANQKSETKSSEAELELKLRMLRYGLFYLDLDVEKRMLSVAYFTQRINDHKVQIDYQNSGAYFDHLLASKGETEAKAWFATEIQKCREQRMLQKMATQSVNLLHDQEGVSAFVRREVVRDFLDKLALEHEMLELKVKDSGIPNLDGMVTKFTSLKNAILQEECGDDYRVGTQLDFLTKAIEEHLEKALQFRNEHGEHNNLFEPSYHWTKILAGWQPSIESSEERQVMTELHKNPEGAGLCGKLLIDLQAADAYVRNLNLAVSPAIKSLVDAAQNALGVRTTAEKTESPDFSLRCKR